MEDETKYYKLIHPGGPGGIMLEKPETQEQDKTFKSGGFYAVVFFPKITGLGKARADWPDTIETLSNSPEAAISKFMDGIKKGETWKTYEDAGHRVRKVKISDLGDANYESIIECSLCGIKLIDPSPHSCDMATCPLSLCDP